MIKLLFLLCSLNVSAADRFIKYSEVGDFELLTSINNNKVHLIGTVALYNHHSSSIDGYISLNTSKEGFFDDGDCSFNIKYSAKEVVINQSNQCGGLGVSYDGVYYLE